MRVLLVEDDEAITMGLSYSLEKEGYEVVTAKNATEARSVWTTGKYDICVLDINLPDGSGYDICRYIKQSEDVPVIFLTAVDAEVNVVMGLEMGADDYICKPFRVGELMARIKSVLRRADRTQSCGTGNSKPDHPEVIGDIRVNTKEAKVVRIDREAELEETIELTALEYRLLLTFVNNRGIVLSRKKLLSDMWDISGDFVNDNTLTVYIKRLRDKIERDPANPEIIRTVRGLGYILDK
ncbi:MAG: response regulator transcription factor [Oscillospiraceae bacterium]|jgi:DNA-binding response OmpR family regulator|nr:response regulator transcription factor [Oscillospiraceae bacterium]